MKTDVFEFGSNNFTFNNSKILISPKRKYSLSMVIIMLVGPALALLAINTLAKENVFLGNILFSLWFMYGFFLALPGTYLICIDREKRKCHEKATKLGLTFKDLKISFEDIEGVVSTYRHIGEDGIDWCVKISTKYGMSDLMLNCGLNQDESIAQSKILNNWLKL